MTRRQNASGWMDNGLLGSLLAVRDRGNPGNGRADEHAGHRRAGQSPGDAVMPLGDHLEELRKRLIWGLLGSVPPLIISLNWWRPILLFLIEPANRAMRARSGGGHAEFQITSFFEMFNSALKMSIIIALVIAGPWLLYQLWLFIAPGLHRHERRFAYIIGPLSLILTACAGLFLYYVMLPVILSFFVLFNSSLEFRAPESVPLPQGVVLPNMPVLEADPPDPAPGMMWYSRALHQVRIAVPRAEPPPDGKVAPPDAANSHAPVEIRGVPTSGNQVVAQQYRIADYFSMLFGFGLALGIGFQMPVVVLLLGWVGILSPRFLSKYRRHAIMVCAILGAVLTPADPISMFVLAVPLYLLYELGVVLLRLFPAFRVRGTATPGDAEHPTADTPEPGAAQAYALPGRGERQDEPPDE